MVSVSPRLRDSLDYEDPEETDPRLTFGFRSLSIEGSEYHHYDPVYDQRPISSSSDSLTARRNRRQRQHDKHVLGLTPFSYRTVADGDVFRLVVIKPGYGSQPIDCQLVWKSSKVPKRDYQCLSYCWQTIDRSASIICDGYRFTVTKNLLAALRSIRSPTSKVLIWIDQICINQDDIEERAQQVAIMKRIFSYSKQVIVWLGEDADNSSNLCEYAKKMRSRDGARASLSRILTPRQLEIAIQKLLERPWFSRVWVIPEACLAPIIKIVIGKSSMSWENLIRLIREVQPPQATGFTKQIALPGNARQRIAILSHMITKQRENKAHTDVSQLLILAKSSQATEIRDKVYAFYGMTVVSTTPDYTRSVEALYTDIALNYVNNIEALYDAWKDLTEAQLTFQLMSILYSAGALHQHYQLPSWVPDWSYPWQLAPVWCKTTSNIEDFSKDDQGEGVRCEYRAGGAMRDHLEIADGMQLKLSVVIVDEIDVLGQDDESLEDVMAAEAVPTENDGLEISPTLQYMRILYATRRHGYLGVATQGIAAKDVLAVILGGDVPVLLRPAGSIDGCNRYHLLCETFVKSQSLMYGEYLLKNWTRAEDVMLI